MEMSLSLVSFINEIECFYPVSFQGNYTNSTTFAIYRNESDYVSSKNPCDVKANITLFSGRNFVEAVFIQRRKFDELIEYNHNIDYFLVAGNFSVIINNNENLILSCETGHQYDSDGPTYLQMSYAGNDKAFKNILYDCPL